MASPGYYTVTLKDYNVKAELTATAHAGFHRYTFQSTTDAGMIIDVSHTLQSHRNEVNQIEIINDHEIRGYKLTKGWAREHHVFFMPYSLSPLPINWQMVLFSLQRIKNQRTVPAKALLKFENLSGKEVLVKVGISAVDFEGAKDNVTKEISDWNFNKGKRKRCSLMEAMA